MCASLCVCIRVSKCVHTHARMYVPVCYKPTPRHCIHLHVQQTPPTLTPQHTLPSPEKKPSQMGGEMLNFPADDLAGSFTPHLWPSVAFHAAAGPFPPGPSTEAAQPWQQDRPAAPETEVPPGPRTNSQSRGNGSPADRRSPEPPPKTRIFQKGFGGLQNALCMLSRSVVSDSLYPHGLSTPRRLCPWDSPGKNTGVGCHLLL